MSVWFFFFFFFLENQNRDVYAIQIFIFLFFVIKKTQFAQFKSEKLQVSEWLLFNASNFSDISWREQINFQWDDDEVRFVLDQRWVGFLQC
jgi:hypothetical protein